MKRLLLLVLLTCGTVLTWAAPVTVQVKTAPLYEAPSATAKFVARVTLGTKLTVEKTQKGWALVTAAGTPALKGWIRTDAYTAKTLTLKAGAPGAEATTEEVSLAGRGFHDDLDGKLKKRQPAVDLSILDRLEDSAIADDELAEFLKAGGLKANGSRK